MEYNFGNKLRTLRREQSLTLYQLADRAKVPFTLLSALENNHQSVGENNATKIGRALGLEGQQLRDFIFLALNKSKRKLLQEYQDYSAELLNLLPTLLMDAGATPEKVKATFIRPDWGTDEADGLIMLNGAGFDIVLRLEAQKK